MCIPRDEIIPSDNLHSTRSHMRHMPEPRPELMFTSIPSSHSHGKNGTTHERLTISTYF